MGFCAMNLSEIDGVLLVVLERHGHSAHLGDEDKYEYVGLDVIKSQTLTQQRANNIKEGRS